MLEILQSHITNRLRNMARLACEQAHLHEFGDNYFGSETAIQRHPSIHPSSAHWRRPQNFPPNLHKLACLQATAGLAQLVEL